VAAHACNPNYWGGRSRRVRSVRPSKAKVVVRPCLKNQRAEGRGCVAQGREHKALGWVPRTTKTKKKKKDHTSSVLLSDIPFLTPHSLLPLGSPAHTSDLLPTVLWLSGNIVHRLRIIFHCLSCRNWSAKEQLIWAYVLSYTWISSHVLGQGQDLQ
jgi:hypothetical protein